MTIRTCIIVPVFNHGAGATGLAQKLSAFGLHLFLVDDGSESRTRDTLRALAKNEKWITLLGHSENRGKGAAVISGIQAAHAQGFSHALQIDADGQHDIADIPRFLALAQANPDAVITGQPIYDESVPKGRLIARYLTHVWVWIETLSFAIRDSMCGFRIYPLKPVAQLARNVHLGQRMDFDPEILVRLHWEGLTIISVPTHVTYPVDGTSHFRPWRDNALISWMHTRLVLGMIWRASRLRLRRPHAINAASDSLR
jgi:glycosyltransferase involved in cell wall biosynthesis